MEELLMDYTPTDSAHAVWLAQALYSCALKQKHTDFKIRAGNTTAHCHKPVLCAQSSFIDGLCAAGKSEAAIDLCIATPEAGRALTQTVRYMYLGTMDLTQDIVEPVLQASETINHPKLKATCESFTLSALTIRNLQKFSGLALQFQLMKLSTACKDLQTQKFSELIHTSWFLPSLSVDDFMRYLQDDQLSVKNEEQVLDAVQKWVSTCTESDSQKEKNLKQLIPHVRLSLCDSRQLESRAGDDGVPAFLRMKLYEYFHNKDVRRVEKPRSGLPAHHTGHPNSTLRIRRHLIERTDLTPVIVGGRITGNTAKGHVMSLNQQGSNTNIKTAKLCDGVSFYSVCVQDDKMIISGGYKGSLKKSVSSVHHFSFSSRQWTEHTDLPCPRDRHGSARLKHHLYIVAGVYAEPYGKIKQWHTVTHVLDLNTGTWTNAADIPLALKNPSVVVVEGVIFVMGGDNSEQKDSLKTVKYKPSKDKWFTCQDMPACNQYSVSSTVAVDSRIFVLAFKDFAVYDTRQDSWNTLTVPLMPSMWCAMVYLEDMLLTMGGYEETSKAPHGRLQVYDLRSKKWSLLEETMPVPLSYHSAFVIRK